MRRKRWQVVQAPPRLEPLCPPGMEVVDGAARAAVTVDRGPDGLGYEKEADAIWAVITQYEDLIEKLHRRLGELDDS